MCSFCVAWYQLGARGLGTVALYGLRLWVKADHTFISYVFLCPSRLNLPGFEPAPVCTRVRHQAGYEVYRTQVAQVWLIPLLTVCVELEMDLTAAGYRSLSSSCGPVSQVVLLVWR